MGRTARGSTIRIIMDRRAHQHLELINGYRFFPLNGLGSMRARIRNQSRALGLAGTVLIAPEGINFSLSGTRAALSEWLEWIRETLGVDRPVLNRQPVSVQPFLRLKVRVRPEIITFDPALRPGQTPAGEHVAPADWNGLLERDGLQLVDTRNAFEVALGSFEGATDPGMASFAGFRQWSRAHLDPARPVALFCTGGVRCEKAGAWLGSQGFEQVFQLRGGILNYLSEVPEPRSRWRGECFVFDDRVSVDHGLHPTGRPVCSGCRKPAVGLESGGMPPVGDDGNCGICAKRFDRARLAGLRERVRQMRLARGRGQRHLGPQG